MKQRLDKLAIEINNKMEPKRLQMKGVYKLIFSIKNITKENMKKDPPGKVMDILKKN